MPANVKILHEPGRKFELALDGTPLKAPITAYRVEAAGNDGPTVRIDVDVWEGQELVVGPADVSIYVRQPRDRAIEALGRDIQYALAHGQKPDLDDWIEQVKNLLGDWEKVIR